MRAQEEVNRTTASGNHNFQKIVPGRGERPEMGFPKLGLAWPLDKKNCPRVIAVTEWNRKKKEILASPTSDGKLGGRARVYGVEKKKRRRGKEKMATCHHTVHEKSKWGAGQGSPSTGGELLTPADRVH